MMTIEKARKPYTGFQRNISVGAKLLPLEASFVRLLTEFDLPEIPIFDPVTANIKELR